MARFSSIRPVQRIKHVVDAQISVPVNLKIDNVLVEAKDTPTLGDKTSVITGSKINGIFLTVEGVTSEGGAGKTPNFYLTIWKNPGNNLSMSAGNLIGTDDNKRYVIHQEMVMLQPSTADEGVPRNIFKGVIVIPKGYRRFGPNDRLIAQYFIPSTGVACQVCLQAHYKEFR